MLGSGAAKAFATVEALETGAVADGDVAADRTRRSVLHEVRHRLADRRDIVVV